MKEEPKFPESCIEEGVVWGKQPGTTKSCTKQICEQLPSPNIGKGCRICTGAIIYAGCTIGDDVFIGDLARVREGAKIGNHCTISPRASIEYDVVLEDGVKIQQGAFVGEESRICSHAFIGPNALLIGDKHMHIDGELAVAPSTIRAHARIGANAVIMPGITVGEGAIVGAGSVVTHDVLCGETVVGSPARPLAKKCE